MKYYPRIIFLDIENKDKRSSYLNSINSLKETIRIKDYVDIREINYENNFGDLNAVMRGLKGTEDLQLPGDEGDKYNFINIVYTDKTDSQKTSELLNKVYESTKFEEQGNVNLYILITSEINNLNTIIPSHSLGQIILQKIYEDGTTLRDDEYDNIVIETLLSLILIPDRQQFIDYIFNRNPQNKVTIFPRLFTYPDKGYLEKIRENLVSNLLVKIKEDKEYDNLSLDFVIPNELFKYLSVNLKDSQVFKHQPKIKVSFFATGKKRLNGIELFYSKYDNDRRMILKEKINEILVERNNPYLIENTKKIEETIYIKIKELLIQKYSFGFVKKSLERLKKNLESDIDKISSWYFLQDLKIPAVDGRPFERVYLIPSLIIIIACLGLLLFAPLYSLVLLIVLIITLSSIGLFYLKDLNNNINKKISEDINTIKNIIEKNPQNFVSAAKQYFIRRAIKVIVNNISTFDKTLKRYENAVDSFRKIKEFETLDATTMKKVESIIQNSIEEIISSTLKKHRQEILSNYKDPDIFFYYLLDNFYKSSYFRDIRNTLFSLNKSKIETQLTSEQKLAISKEINSRNIRIGNRKKILVSNIYETDSFEIIESADDYILSILNTGVINE